ncbi:MAG: outer rane efflux protein [Myxococcales bacterium]|nr:outer rane efflux protein [Myxococcales bacterium]
MRPRRARRGPFVSAGLVLFVVVRTLAVSALAVSALALSFAGDALAAPPAAPVLTRVTWQQALDRAFERNASAIVAAQEIERASALVREARAGWLPTFTGNGSYSRLDSARTFNGNVTTPIGQWNGNLALTVPLLAPTAWANDAHAQDNRDVARANAADVRRQLAVAVGRAYLTVLLQHRALDVSVRARETAFAHYDYAHTRMEKGLGNGVDDARAEQQLRTIESQVKSAETALVRAQSALAILLSAEDLVDAVDDVTLGATSSPDAALDDARAHRPDLKALESRRVATDHLRRDDWTYYAPTLLAQAQAFRQTQTALQPGSGWQAAIVLSIPFFDGGFRYGVQRERRALDLEAQAQLAGLLRQVSLEVRTAFAVVRNADESLQAARAAATAATTAATLADKAYRGGATTNIEVIDAERQARDAESQVALAEDAARQARLDLLVATGAFPQP